MNPLAHVRSDIEAAWQRFVAGGRAPRGIRPEIRRSWERAHKTWNVDPRLRAASSLVSGAPRPDDPLTAIASGVLERFGRRLESGGHVVAFFDARGVMLRVDGNARTRRVLEDVNFAPGACWAEHVVGTNGPGTSLVEGHSVEVFAAEHFVEAWQPWNCASAPVSFRGQVVGAVDITSPWTAREPSLLVTAEALACAVESQLEASATGHQASILLKVAEDALASRDDFLAVASHEVKTPLTPLRVALQLVQRQLRDSSELDPARLEQLLRRADLNVERLARAIDYLTDSARFASESLDPKLEPVELGEVVLRAARACADEAIRSGCELRVSVEPRCVVRCDAGLVERAIRHLVGNAIKYAPGCIEVHLAVESGTARLRVSDHGPGIAPADQARIFEPYARAVSSLNHSGLGLGLDTVRRIAEAHAGAVRVESAVHAGSTFTLELPCADASSAGTQWTVLPGRGVSTREARRRRIHSTMPASAASPRPASRGAGRGS